MDAVFSQASFATPIDIRFETPVYINDPTYLDIDTSAKLSGLWGLAPFGIPTVNMFFVDTIDYCGGYNTGIVGCGSFPGNIFAVESSFADSTWGTELAAHELAHNLGLGHVTGSNLMNPSLNGNTDLTGSQVATIFASPLVQHDGSGYFISITPIAITAVPLPGAVLLFGSGIIGLAFIRRRQTQTA